MQVDRLEERSNVIQEQHQYDVNSLKQEYQKKIRILQTELDQKLSTVRNLCIFLVCLLFLLVCLMLYLTKSGVQENLEEKVSVIQSQHEKKVNTVKKSLEDKVDSLDTCLRVIEESRIFTWKITNIALKFREAKNEVKEIVESDPFYRYGYKLKLRLHPNGNKKKAHLSIYITVMKGEYDAILPWPFKTKVKFTLIDQQKDSVERKNVTKQFITSDLLENFARPTREENPGRGFVEFISHEKLHSRRYLVDDTLFLLVEIGPSSS